MGDELLAVVGVSEQERVACQADGCGRGVYRRIHIVRKADGTLGVFGADCFAKLFGALETVRPRYGGGEGRELTHEQRQALVENTARLIAQFEEERQASLDRERSRQAHYDQVAAAASARAVQRKAEADRRRPLTDAEIAPVLQQARQAVRAKYGPGLDLDSPGWVGLVRQEARRLLGR